MEKVKFKDIFYFAPKSKVKAGQGLEKGKFPFYTSSPILSKRIDVQQYFTEALVFGTGGSASIHYVNEPFSTSTDCLVTVNSDKYTNTKYVYYFIFSNIHILQAGFKGAGLKHISKTYIQEIEIPLPDLETQNKIVAILDKAKIILDKRKETIKSYDELLRATFLNIFGDPVLNPNKFEVRNLKDFYINEREGTKCGPFGSALKLDEYQKNGIPVWNMDNISKSSMEFISQPNLFINETKYQELEKYSVSNGDIIISRAGTVGKMCIVDSNFDRSIISTNLIRLRLNQELLSPLFFIHLMRFAGKGLFRLKKGAEDAFGHMSTTILDSLKFPYPPIQLQKEFLKIFREFKSLNIKQRNFLQNSDSLLKSLAQQVFSERITIDVDAELEALINAIDIEKKDEENIIDSITNDITFIQRLIDRLSEQQFEDKEQYDKAKYVFFRMMKEEGDLVKQVFKNNEVHLTL
jgi:type I restriction enzyme S subunit